MIPRIRALLALPLLFLIWQAPALAQQTPPGHAIASAHPLATEAGLEILDAGGNAFDAAVAITATLAVVEPYGSGMGGGGFWLLHRASDGFQTMIDGRETAPAEADRDMYLDAEGALIREASLNGPLAAGIPGTPAALAHITEHYGRLSLAESLSPAIRHARQGFAVDEHYRRMAGFRRDVLRASAEAAAIFLKNNDIPPAGHRIVQKDLARVLERLARRGPDSFYRGDFARELAASVREAGGIWQTEDLAAYRIKEREPVSGAWGDIRITSAALPSAGGIGIVTMLALLEDQRLAELEEADRIHLLAEAMRRVYRDRMLYLGDPDFADVPVQRLLGENHLAFLRSDLDPERATPSSDLPTPPSGGEDTTHFSVIDDEGNRVGATLSINYPFGSGFVAAGTGILLNNEMDDFATRPGEPNAYGLVGGLPNAIEPGKRPLSSMTPTFMETDDRVAVLGTPGGSRIITQVLLTTLAFAENDDPDDWVSRPRFHHQYEPDRIEHEPGAISDDVRRELEARGHTVEAMGRRYGDMQAVLWHRGQGWLDAASDPRGGGLAVVRNNEDKVELKAEEAIQSGHGPLAPADAP